MQHNNDLAILAAFLLSWSQQKRNNLATKIQKKRIGPQCFFKHYIAHSSWQRECSMFRDSIEEFLGYSQE